MAAQQFQPKSIQFKGDPEYSDAELLAASGLKKGEVLTAADMNAHSKILMDTGIFENLTFTFNGQDLVFQIVPAKALYPIRYENLPLVEGKELDAKLHAQLPLYHGKVPMDGTLLEDVRKALEQELAAKGIQATLVSVPYSEHVSEPASAMSILMSNPPIAIGQIHLDGASADLAAKANTILQKNVGKPYNAYSSASELEVNLVNFYTELGYLQVAAQATVQLTPVVDAGGVHLPYAVTVTEGPVFKLAHVQLAPGMLVTQADFDKQSRLHSGEVVSPAKLREEWKFLARQYHNKGYAKAQILPTQTLDAASGTVSYTVAAEPGPIYTMGKLTVENVSEDLRAAILKAWPVAAGTPFNEGAILGMVATHDVNPALERVFATVDLRYTLHLNEDVRTVDVNLRLERKH
ncbi:POTRA domain-containing protein [Acidicapsa ligni]|uniref:POTRA domain-containing protein n=1 Tax=Acidicapsa ligni TaxID=542300 RepID=UPI0021E085E1|nr:POTRA domain-containing protein [Acidicapsa ligni]